MFNSNYKKRRGGRTEDQDSESCDDECKIKNWHYSFEDHGV